MTIKFTIDKKSLEGVFGAELKKQIRFATAQTLTAAAWDSRRAVQTMLRRRLDIKKTFLPNSVIVIKATKQNPRAIVGFLDRAKLAELLEEGGTRRPRGQHIAIPHAVKSATGRVSKAKKPKALLASGKAFEATINGQHGIWMKVKKGGKTQVRLAYDLEPKTKYVKNTMRFYRTVEGTAPASIKRNFGPNLERALASRKR